MCIRASPLPWEARHHVAVAFVHDRELVVPPSAHLDAHPGLKPVGGLRHDLHAAPVARREHIHLVPILPLERWERPLALPSPCLLYTSPSPRDRTRSRMPSSA
eukprot:TRINITY_DN21410_c0_g1_i1.p1 TRINITY_DN21410_c0_g1~~TRINITY_DN21410_c0_g1_i1.p1  ORF type:complete len:103 (+),score=26.33 TRINITY_DN21410_c0_g1_i1:89-397(+)